MSIADLSTWKPSLVEHLRHHPYFNTLDTDRLAALTAQATCHAFAPGELIFLEGEPSAGLWIIGKGRVKIYRLNPEGSEHILHLLGPGNSFNDIAALDGGPNPAHAAALSEVAACVFPHDVLAATIRRDPDLAMAVIRVITRRTRSLVQQIEDLALYSVTTRLARFLLRQAENPALSGPGITRATIAAHLATQPETVSRALSALEKSGIIRLDRHRIRIVREDLLRMVALL